MTFDEFIEDGLGKANRLFAKLAQTGPSAVKTRERLFVDLKAELSHLSRFERHHLIPALGDESHTRSLVTALEHDSAKVADLLSELETAPRVGETFLQKLSELQGAFQAHVRDERKALLPAVLDALHRAKKAEADAQAAQVETQVEAAADSPAVAPTAIAIPQGEIEPPRLTAPEPAALEPAALEPQPVEPEPVAPQRADAPEPSLKTVPIPSPLAAITMLQPLAPALTPAAGFATAPPRSALLPLPTPTYGVQAWTNLMQEAAAGAMLGYKLLLAYSNNTGFAALQTRLMKEQLELMTKSGAKMMEAAQRLGKTGE